MLINHINFTEEDLKTFHSPTFTVYVGNTVNRKYILQLVYTPMISQKILLASCCRKGNAYVYEPVAVYSLDGKFISLTNLDNKEHHEMFNQAELELSLPTVKEKGLIIRAEKNLLDKIVNTKNIEYELKSGRAYVIINYYSQITGERENKLKAELERIMNSRSSEEMMFVVDMRANAEIVEDKIFELENMDWEKSYKRVGYSSITTEEIEQHKLTVLSNLREQLLEND